MNEETDSRDFGPLRSLYRVISAIEVAAGVCLLGWGIFVLQGNGWSLLFKGPGAEVVAGLIIFAIGTGSGLMLAAAGLLWMRRWPFLLHAPLIIFFVLISYPASRS